MEFFRKVYKLNVSDKIPYSKTIIYGIYAIRNTINGKLYFGSSNHCYLRWNHHRTQLRNNKHCNKHLQKAWNKYGESNFRFYCTEFRNADDFALMLIEAQYIKDYPNHYNICTEPNQTRRGLISEKSHVENIKKGLTGRKLSEEHKNNLRGKRPNTLGHTNNKVKQIIQSTTDGQIVNIWNTSINKLSKILNFSTKELRNSLHNKPHGVENFKFQYSE